MARSMHISEGAMKIGQAVLFAAVSLGLSGCFVGITPLDSPVDPTLPVPVLAPSAPGPEMVQLTWSAVDVADDYTIVRDGAALTNAGAPVTTYVDAGLTDGQNYCYQVAAVRASSRSEYSNVQCATPMGTPVLSTTARSLAATITWSPGAGAASYNLYSLGATPSPDESPAKADGGATRTLITNTPATTYEDTGLSNNCLTYNYEVVSVDANGTESIESSQPATAEPDTIGVLDETFGAAGVVTYVDDGRFMDVMVASDGTILALLDGEGFPDQLVAFAQNGSVLWAVEFTGLDHSIDRIKSFALDSGGVLYVVGNQPGPNPRVCRMIGTPALGYVFDDANFQNGGLVGCIMPTGLSGGTVQSVAIDAADRILVSTGQSGVLRVDRILSTGADDESFSFLMGGGYLDVLPVPLVVMPMAAGERVVVAGSTIAPVFRMFVLDDTGGVVASGPDYDGVAKSVMVDSMSNLVFVSERVAPNEPRIVHTDSDLNELGLFTYAYPNGTGVTESGQLDCHGRTILAGRVSIPSFNNIIGVGRTLTDFSALDATFGVDGWFDYPNTMGVDSAYASAIDAVGRIVLAGTLNAGLLPPTPAILRLK